MFKPKERYISEKEMHMRSRRYLFGQHMREGGRGTGQGRGQGHPTGPGAIPHSQGFQAHV